VRGCGYVALARLAALAVREDAYGVVQRAGLHTLVEALHTLLDVTTRSVGDHAHKHARETESDRHTERGEDPLCQ
jgi:hypothetical protein